VISDDDRQNNLLEKAKGKICPPFCSLNIGKNLSSMIAEDIHHQGTVFKDLDSPFSNKFNLALSQSRKNSSPGLDQISYTMLSALSAKYKELLLNLFNRFL